MQLLLSSIQFRQVQHDEKSVYILPMDKPPGFITFENQLGILADDGKRLFFTFLMVECLAPQKGEYETVIDLFIDTIASPVGTILLVTDGEKLCALDYTDCEPRMLKLLQARYGPVRLKKGADACGFNSALRAYLAGDLTAIDHIPVHIGGTSFQQQVCSALRMIPPGSVLTYGEMAMQLGRSTASRAVGMANALNPVAIVIPCHRLVGAHGALTGYAGGLERKRWLLAHEGIKFDGEKVKTL